MARRYTLEIAGKSFTLDVEETQPDRFQVVVDGQAYDVQLSGDEDLPEASITPAFEPGRHATAAGAGDRPAAAAKRPAPRAAAAASSLPPRRAPAGGGSGTLAAPMPGVVLEVMVKAGDVVKRGQEIAVLEAMKMQNMIRSPRDATIAEVCATAGQAVGHGDCIVRFAEG